MRPDSKEMTEMDRKQMTTIMYLIVSMLLFLSAVLMENPMFGPVGLIFLIMGGVNSGMRDEKGY